MATSEEVLQANAGLGSGTETPGNLPNVGKDEFLKGFWFEGITQKGRERMKIEAPSEKVLREWLEDGHIEVIKIQKIKGRIGRRSKKIKQKELANFVGQMAKRKASGQGDIDAIKSCAEGTSNYALRFALNEVAQRMEQGIAPDEAFAASYIYDSKKKIHTKKPTFPKEFIHQIKASSRGGAVKLLKDYESRLRRTIKKKSEIFSKLIYPAITVGLALILSQVMVFVVIPSFKPMYEGILGDSSMKLPFLTRVVTGASDFATSSYGVLLLASLAAGILGFFYWTFSPKARRFEHLFFALRFIRDSLKIAFEFY